MCGELRKKWAENDVLRSKKDSHRHENGKLRKEKFASIISWEINLVVSQLNFIISQEGFESGKLCTPVRPLFIGTEACFR